MCIYCDGLWEQREIRLDDSLSTMDGGALCFDTDVKDVEDVYLYRELASRFSWASLVTAEELGGEESCLDIVFTVNDDGDGDDSGATWVSVGFRVYFCPWCGRDLRPARAEGVSANAKE